VQALRRRLAVARGDAPADLVIRGASVLSVFTKEWLEADVAIVDGVVAGASSYVPASRFESPRRPLTAGDLQGLLRLVDVDAFRLLGLRV